MTGSEKPDQHPLTRRDVLKKSLVAASALWATTAQRADAQEASEEEPLSGGATLLIGNFSDPDSPFPDLYFIPDEQLDQFKLDEELKIEVFRNLRFVAGRFSPLTVESAFELGLDGLVGQSKPSQAQTSSRQVQAQAHPATDSDGPAAQLMPFSPGPLITVVAVGSVRKEVERFSQILL